MKQLICITCPNSCHLTVDENSLAVSGNKCKRGEAFAVAELTNPTRSVSSLVKTTFDDFPVLSVRTDGEIPKSKIPDLMRLLKQTVVDKRLAIGEVVIPDALSTGVNVISTKNM